MKEKLLIILSLAVITLTAQDIHFSQFSAIRSSLNPALIGYQQQDYQIQLQRRSQWESVTKPFSTFSIALNGKNIYNKFSIGVQFIDDKAGDSNFSTNGIVFSLSRINKIFNHQNFSFGGSAGYYRRGLDQRDLFFIDVENIPSYSKHFFDLSLGIVHEYEFKQNISLLSGISIFHINTPNQSFFENNNVELKTNNKIHSSIIYYYKQNIQIKPGFYYSQQGMAKEFVFGANLNYLLTKYKKDVIVIRAAIHNRYNDAVIPSLGVKIDNFDIMTSYDINTSSLVSASEYKGGFEFSIIYNWEKDNKTSNKPIIVCPKYL